MSSYRRRLLLANQSEENLVLYGNSVQEGTPTPDAPIEIMSLENPTVKVTGDNLCKITRNKETISSKGYSIYVNDDNSITINGTPTEEQYPVLCNNLTLPPGTYTISGGKGGSNTTWQMYVYLPNTTQKYYFANHITGYYTFTLKEEQTGKITLILRKDATFDNLTIYPMLNKGTEALPYEPYEEELITIDETTPFGKNLIPTYTGADYQGSLYTCTHNGDGTFVINGTGNGSSYANCCTLAGSSLNDLLANGETYTFSLNCSDTTTTSACLVIRYREISTGTDRWYSNSLSKCTRFTANKDVYDYQQLYIQINPNTQTFTNVIVKPMLARGSYTELPFEPYIPPITTMRGIGNYKDRIYTKDGKVWFEQRSAWYETDASDTVRFNTNHTIGEITSSQYYIADDSEGLATLGALEQKAANHPGLCSHFEYRHNAYSGGKGNTAIVLGSTIRRFWFLTDKFADANEATLWLDENTIAAIYPLKTSIITEITGALAEKILAIDKSKNITIYSDNGVYGNIEIIDD